MRGSPPLRFLAVVLGGWVALRSAFLAPPWSTPPVGAAAVQGRARALPHPGLEDWRAPGKGAVARRIGTAAAAIPPSRAIQPRPQPIPAALLPAPAPSLGVSRRPLAIAAASPSPPPLVVLPPTPASASTRRWSLSAWAFVRRGGAAPLAAAGLLGGSQAGARLVYRLDSGGPRPLALSVRLATPLERAAGAEAALGVDWKPLGRLPVHLLAERRQALGREGRSAFSLTAFGGVSEAPLGRFRLDAYAQAGLVGARARDLFADGSVRLSLPLGRDLRVGAGAWAAAQPGLARLDLGPQAALRLPGRSVTLAADWRLRAAGNAAPGSGPTVTLSTDF
jgi:hypothetical protein